MGAPRDRTSRPWTVEVSQQERQETAAVVRREQFAGTLRVLRQLFRARESSNGKVSSRLARLHLVDEVDDVHVDGLDALKKRDPVMLSSIGVELWAIIRTCRHSGTVLGISSNPIAIHSCCHACRSCSSVPKQKLN